MLFQLIVSLDAVVYILFELPTLDVREFLEVEFKRVCLVRNAIFDNFVDSYQLLSVQKVDIMPQSLPLLDSHRF